MERVLGACEISKTEEKNPDKGRKQAETAKEDGPKHQEKRDSTDETKQARHSSPE